MAGPHRRVRFWARLCDPHGQGQFGPCGLHERVSSHGQTTRACEAIFTDLFTKVAQVARVDCEPIVGS
ncbi:hypothetical protein J1N35_038871, partial [Gossypium stocksii]